MMVAGGGQSLHHGPCMQRGAACVTHLRRCHDVPMQIDDDRWRTSAVLPRAGFLTVSTNMALAIGLHDNVSYRLRATTIPPRASKRQLFRSGSCTV